MMYVTLQHLRSKGTMGQHILCSFSVPGHMILPRKVYTFDLKLAYWNSFIQNCIVGLNKCFYDAMSKRTLYFISSFI